MQGGEAQGICMARRKGRRRFCWAGRLAVRVKAGLELKLGWRRRVTRR